MVKDADAIRRFKDLADSPRLSLASVHAAAEGILLGLASEDVQAAYAQAINAASAASAIDDSPPWYSTS